MSKLIREVSFLDLENGIGRTMGEFFSWDISDEILTYSLRDIFLNDVPKTFMITEVEHSDIRFKIESLVF